MCKINTILASIGIVIGFITNTSGQNFGPIGGKPPFNILPYYPYPENLNNIFSYLQFPFQNFRPQRPQVPPNPSIQQPPPNNPIPVDQPQSQSSLGNSNGLASFFPLPNLNNQSPPARTPGQTNLRSIGGSNKPVYTILPFNLTATPFRPQINQLGTQPQVNQPDSMILMSNNPNPTSTNEVDAAKSPKIFLPVLVVPTG